VPERIQLHSKLCKVTLDFTDALIPSTVLRIDAEIQHGKLIIVTSPGIVIDTGDLTLTYSKVKLKARKAAADHPRLRIEIVGALYFAKVIEQG
jgi:hypothetical protein